MWIGIDFGTCNSCASAIKNNAVKLVADPASNSHIFPSSVYIETNGQVLVGQAAENKQTQDINRYKRAFKPNLGQKTPFILGEYQKYPLDLVTEVLKKLKSETERQVTSSTLQSAVVLTVPAKYEKPLRTLMHNAAKKAGFREIEILEEPVAAAIYYASQTQSKVQDGDIFLVYDLGGGTFDATLVRRRGLRYELLGAPDGIQIGGEDFDDCIYHDLLSANPALRTGLSDPRNKSERFHLRAICREIKHTLTIQKEVSHSFVMFGQSISYQRKRGEFISLIRDKVDETIACCEKLIKRANIDTRQIRCVLLVGGSCRIPFIEERLRQKLNIDVFQVDKPELAVSMGAAYYGDALDRAAAFVQRINELAESSAFQRALTQRLPELTTSLVQFHAPAITQKAVRPALKRWQQGQIKALNDLQPAVEKDVEVWLSSLACQAELQHLSTDWVKRRLPQLTSLTDPICDQYQVSRDILQLQESIPQLQAIPAVSINTNKMVGAGLLASASGVVVGTVLAGILVTIVATIVAAFHARSAGGAAARMVKNAFNSGKSMTEGFIRNANLPQWMRTMLCSDEKLESEIQKAQETLAKAITADLEKNKEHIERFVRGTQSILVAAMREQAEKRAQVIWLHQNDEQWLPNQSRTGNGKYSGDLATSK